MLHQLYQTTVVARQNQLPVRTELTTGNYIVEATGELRRGFKSFKVDFFLIIRLRNLVEVQVRADSHS